MCSGLVQSDAAFDPEGVFMGLKLDNEPEEEGELNGVSSTVVAYLGADTGIGCSDGCPIFLALQGLELSFFSLERTYRLSSFSTSLLLLHFGVRLIKVSPSSESVSLSDMNFSFNPFRTTISQPIA